MSLLPPLMLGWSVGSFGLIMFRYFFLSWLLLICWLLACLFFFLSDACSKPAIPKVHRMSQHTWAQSTLQLITLLRAGHGKVLATECVRRWWDVQSANTTSACSTAVAASTRCRYYCVQAGQNSPTNVQGTAALHDNLEAECKETENHF